MRQRRQRGADGTLPLQPRDPSLGILGQRDRLQARDRHAPVFDDHRLSAPDALEERAAEVRHLTAERTRLRRRLALDDTGAALVREARRLGLVRPDERLFIIKGIDAWRRARAVERAAER